MSFQRSDEQTIANSLETETREALREIFTESGMETVLYYLQVDYKTTLRDVWENPSKFQRSLVVFLGEFGGTLLMRRIVRRMMEFRGTPLVKGSKDISLEDTIRDVFSLEDSKSTYSSRLVRNQSM